MDRETQESIERMLAASGTHVMLRSSFFLRRWAPPPRTVRVAGTLSLIVLAGCTSIVGLDVTYEDGSGGGTTSTAAATGSGGGGTTTGASSASSSAASSPSSSSSSGSTGGDGGGGSGSGNGGGGNGGSGGDCVEAELLSDDFDGDELNAAWTMIEDTPGLLPEGYVVDGGALTFGAEAPDAQWFGDGPGGPFVYQLVEGDFFAWTRVRITRDGVADPTETYHGGGLLLREPLDPPGTTETFVMAVVGVGGTEDVCKIGGNVDAGGTPQSPLELPDETPCSADLAICRLGGVTRVFGRETSGDDWLEVNVLAQFADEAFPDQLQIGPAMYSYDHTEDTIGEFEHVRFEATCGRSCQDILDAIEGD